MTGTLVDETLLCQCFWEICYWLFRVAPTGILEVSFSSYFYQSAWHHNQNSVIFEIQYFSTELKASCNCYSLVFISIKGHWPVNYNGRLTLIGIQTGTPIVFLRFGWANRNWNAQILLILSRTSVSSMGPWETSQDSSLSIICFVIRHVSPDSTILFTVWSDVSQKLSRNSLHCHMSQQCHSIDVQQLNLQQLTLQGCNYNVRFLAARKYTACLLQIPDC